MRLELHFTLDKPTLPQDYKCIFISFLKNALTQCNKGKFFDQYFVGTKMKDYTFSVFLPKPQFQGEMIVLEDNQIRMLFSADDRNKTGLIFFSAFIEQKHKRFPLPGDNSMTLKNINQLGEHLITSSRVVFRTVIGGGLVVREHNSETNKDRFLTYQDRDFVSRMREILIIQAREAGFPGHAMENFQFKPIQCKKVLVKCYGIFVDTTVGLFEMEADPDLLQYFYHAGVSAKHSLGFGMLDVAAQI